MSKQRKVLDLRNNSEVVKNVTPAKEDPDKVRAKRYADMIANQRLAFQARGIQNVEGLIEAQLLVRRSLFDQLLDPRHDIDRDCGYPEEISITMYRLMYERDGISKRVVDVFPDESWAMYPEVIETPDPKQETEFEKAWEELVKKFNLWHILHRADRLSGIGTFGVILLGLADGRNLEEPVDGINEYGEMTEGTEHKLLFIRPFDESVVRVDTRESNILNPRFGCPIYYTLTFRDVDLLGISAATSVTVGDITKKVHWSRLIHLADNRDMSEIYGTPRMKPVFNRLMDVRKVLSGSGEMFWKGAFPGMSFEFQPGVGDAELDTATVRDEMESYQQGLQRYLALTGMTAKMLAPQVADPTHHLDEQIKAICIALAVPLRIFTGTEEARLASSQDAKTWARRVGRRNYEYVSPMVVRPFVDRLIAFGILPVPEDYDVLWPDLSTVTDTEKAQIMLTKTQAMQSYVQGGCDILIPPNTYLQSILELAQEEIDQISEARVQEEVLDREAIAPPPPPTPPGGGDGPRLPRTDRPRTGTSTGSLPTAAEKA